MKEKSHYKAGKAGMFASLSLALVLSAGTKLSTAQTSVHVTHAGSNGKLADIVRDPADVPAAVGNRKPAVVQVALTAEEVVGTLDPAAGTTYRYWTFNGKVPGPMIRVKQGDTVEVTLHNAASSHMAHSVDFHAALGPGGGAALSQAVPGQTKKFTFQATTPGLYVYHCGTPMIGEHIANGMYGLILVEPQSGLSPVDREYYVMQGEIYTTAPKGKPGLQQFSGMKLLEENPQYFVFNGAVDALSKNHPMTAKVGDTVRVYFGDAGPNATSSLHVVGEIFTKDYSLGTLTSPPLTGVQTASIPAGGAAMLEFKASTPGQFNMMDHAMARMAKGLMATFQISGPEDATLMHAGGVTDSTSPRLSGMTQADQTKASAVGIANAGTDVHSSKASRSSDSASETHMQSSTAGGMEQADSSNESASKQSNSTSVGLNGCLRLSNDGKAMLKLLRADKLYRLEARPLLFSENANRLVHVTGYFGSVVPVEDPRVPSFVVDTVDKLAPSCSVNLSDADIRKALTKPEGPRGVVGMNDMAFLPATITINAGEKVVWKNSSQTIHNVVDDAGKALNKVDVKLPPGGNPFDSGLLQPGQTFSRVFAVPGVYRYVCTLHEGMGMKAVVIVRPSAMLAANRQEETK